MFSCFRSAEKYFSKEVPLVINVVEDIVHVVEDVVHTVKDVKTL